MTTPTPTRDCNLTGVAYHEVESVKAVEYCLSRDGTGPASEVHLVIRVRGVASPLVMRYDQAEALDELVGSLEGYGASVWPRRS